MNLSSALRSLASAAPRRAFSFPISKAARLTALSSSWAASKAKLYSTEAPTSAKSTSTPASQTSAEFKVTSEVPPPNSNDVFGNGNGNLEAGTDWSKSYSGLSQEAFPKEISDILMAPIDPMDIEMKPDGLIYLPEIKYRRILNRAFGPGGWGLAPRSETNVGPKIVSREYALVCLGRLVAIARGEQEYFDPSGIPTATESVKSNALMRCCKDLGIASELWDPRFIREFKAKYCIEVFAEHVPTKKKKKLWRRKDQGKFAYPYQE
ncbi:mitochondrial genome maintenance MGM101 [Dendrothele bispora CBS 962.96]|uniref:Mitochondrial genome maintenance protein MGM101 n=1 Tax=Dendrothele bispora (strain CBS 962.96) TaxID=1314807 RepID=A0A4S8LL11_DENBC|nr:mitochondrial genome maintenance MGM101 [Dendrothele bispora CBS 962.96]